MSTITKSSSTARAEQLLAGTKVKYPNGSDKLSFGGADYTVAEVEAKLQSVVDLRGAAEEAKAASKTKVAAEQARLPALRVFMGAYVAFLKAAFGNVPDALAIFGLPPKKVRAPLTAEQTAAAVAKRAATRAARQTKGKVARKAVKGNVTGVAVIPIVAGKPEPAPSAVTEPSPAPAAGASATPTR
jgi:hypothetical protein